MSAKLDIALNEGLTVEQVAQMSTDDMSTLTNIKGIGEVTAKAIIEEAQEMMGAQAVSTSGEDTDELTETPADEDETEPAGDESPTTDIEAEVTDPETVTSEAVIGLEGETTSLRQMAHDLSVRVSEIRARMDG